MINYGNDMTPGYLYDLYMNGQIKLLDNHNDGEYTRLEPNKKLNIVCDSETFEMLYKELSYRDFTILLSLCKYIRPLDCFLVDDNNNYLNMKQLSTLLNIQYNKLTTIFKYFFKRGILKKLKVTSSKSMSRSIYAIAVNPNYIGIGGVVSKSILSKFDSVQKSLDTNNIPLRWSLYMHVLPSEISSYEYDKTYIGLTANDPKARWNNGNGYKGNDSFYYDIVKFGWENFEHYVIAEGLTQEEANDAERAFIGLFDSQNPLYGYNKSDGGNISSPQRTITKCA